MISEITGNRDARSDKCNHDASGGRRAMDASGATIQLTRFDAGLSIHFAGVLGIVGWGSAAMGLLETA